MNRVELLAPAGSVEALNAAVNGGADAVYLGLKNFNARLRCANFTYGQFEGALRGLHRAGRRLYAVLNTVFEQREADRMYQTLKYLSKSGCDGIIVQDFGVLEMARAYFPSMKIHSSTQMNVSSAKAANLLSKEGVTRAVLARELSFEEIKSIRGSTNIELEVFVHGSLCVSESGLCLFSSYLGGKSANRGMCTQACRRLYFAGNSDSGAYYFSPRDLRLLEKIPSLVEAGVDSFKIEGRMKSADYVGCVVHAYRTALDAVLNGGAGELAGKGMALAAGLLKNDFAREKTMFHFDGMDEAGDVSAWLNPSQDGGTGIKLGAIGGIRDDGGLRMALVKRFGENSGGVLPEAGDSIRIHSVDDAERSSHKVKYVEHETEDSFWIDVPAGFSAGDNVYLISVREMSRRYRPILQKDADGSHTHSRPGFEKAPPVKFPPVKREAQKDFPEGLYVSVSRIEDMYVAQSVKPAALIFAASRGNIRRLLHEKKPLPFKAKDTILSLPPFFAEGDAAFYEDALGALAGAGYSRYIVNNLAHIQLLKNINAALISGPYLYTFNRYAVSFLAAHQLYFFVTPLENNRQNLERTFDTHERGGVFVTVFAYPHLFRIRSALNGSGLYDFSEFTDKRGEVFRFVRGDGESCVLPGRAFSIIDKIPFLMHSGFKRFIVDFSGPVLHKADYKTVTKAASEATVLSGTARFNWKDGFYSQEKPRDMTASENFVP
ncbi:MAG: U32 family peptidase [Spirochaetaceae bacterium]|jgi:putative protease|nr:U32 family peptidase [Spirochaetaceae bacterium]